MILFNRVTVGATPTALHATSAYVGQRLTIKNSHATDALVLGDSSVAAGTGFSLAAGATMTVEITAGDRLFGIRGAAADIIAHVLIT